MLKPYMERESASPSPAVLKSVVALSGAEIIDQAEASVALSSADLLESADSDCDLNLSSAVVHGRLKNSEMLANLNGCVSHLSPSQHEDVVRLIDLHGSLFSDVTSQTHVLQHDVDVGDSPPIKQHACRVNPDKRARCVYIASFICYWPLFVRVFGCVQFGAVTVCF